MLLLIDNLYTFKMQTHIPNSPPCSLQNVIRLHPMTNYTRPVRNPADHSSCEGLSQPPPLHTSRKRKMYHCKKHTYFWKLCLYKNESTPKEKMSPLDVWAKDLPVKER
ncbi:hypothetical protein CDAR_74801 [Caerostris darwini]|uniref:Uncharacterized protein n=1 Tax=Caerostris darwini TaxID=1538125 RepID=A0AAV4P5S4_9ARAC|nr:hypothetical protein CDAR_74801 [Caerostris darwini]